MTDSPLFIELETLKYPLVNQFYKHNYKKGMARKSEKVYVLTLAQQIICSAKLKLIEQQQLLTGVVCDEQYQHKGYASQLIKQLLSKQEQPVYCLPYTHLEHFYLRLGFTLLPIEQAPDEIQSRFEGYTQQRKLLLMIYKKSK